jgi:hypothetical protein
MRDAAFSRLWYDLEQEIKYVFDIIFVLVRSLNELENLSQGAWEA